MVIPSHYLITQFKYKKMETILSLTAGPPSLTEYRIEVFI